MLSNVVLDELDKELESRGLEHCRFADDCNIFVASEKSAHRVMQSISKFIEKRLKLIVNWEKSKVVLSKSVKFLGMTVVAGTIAISAQSMKRAAERVRQLTLRGTSVSMEKTIAEINGWYAGWASYHEMTQYPAQLSTIEAHIRRRLRARIVSQQKRRHHLFDKVVKEGVNRLLAAKTVYSNKRKWALSHSRAVEKAFPNRWFIHTLGQKIVSNKKFPHWFDTDVWIKFT